MELRPDQTRPDRQPASQALSIPTAYACMCLFRTVPPSPTVPWCSSERLKLPGSGLSCPIPQAPPPGALPRLPVLDRAAAARTVKDGNGICM